MDFSPGEVHAVLGENGAGKSTLMGVLSGFVMPDSGSVTLNGQAFPLGDAQAVQALGVAMVHQHFMLVPALSFAENMALANLGSSGPWLDVEALARPAVERGKDLGWTIDPGQTVRGSSVGIQQRAEILKALAHDASVVILDEPTAVLAPHEVEDLFRVVRSLRDEGKTVVLIAHKLDEVMAVADRLTVLRAGRWVGSSPIGQTDRAEITAWMVGELPEPKVREPREATEVRLQVVDLKVKGDRGEDSVRGVSFEVKAGEVLGIGGVDGNGQLELAEAIVGVRLRSGLVEANGEVGYLPQDRQSDGLALDLSIQDNLLAGGSQPLSKPERVRVWAEGIVRQFDVRFGKLTDPVRSLSGGNQQKIVVGRALDRSPGVVVAMSPTRGLDLKATEFVRSQLTEAAERGAAVLLISTDNDELAQLSDRTLYMNRGRLYDEFLEDA